MYIFIPVMQTQLSIWLHLQDISLLSRTKLSYKVAITGKRYGWIVLKFHINTVLYNDGNNNHVLKWFLLSTIACLFSSSSAYNICISTTFALGICMNSLLDISWWTVDAVPGFELSVYISFQLGCGSCTPNIFSDFF